MRTHFPSFNKINPWSYKVKQSFVNFPKNLILLIFFANPKPPLTNKDFRTKRRHTISKAPIQNAHELSLRDISTARACKPYLFVKYKSEELQLFTFHETFFISSGRVYSDTSAEPFNACADVIARFYDTSRIIKLKKNAQEQRSVSKNFFLYGLTVTQCFIMIEIYRSTADVTCVCTWCGFGESG